MRSIETTLMVEEDGTATLRLPEIAPGKHRVVVVIEERANGRQDRPPLRFSAYPAGPVSDDITFRRTELYGDAER